MTLWRRLTSSIADDGLVKPKWCCGSTPSSEKHVAGITDRFLLDSRLPPMNVARSLCTVIFHSQFHALRNSQYLINRIQVHTLTGMPFDPVVRDLIVLRVVERARYVHNSQSTKEGPREFRKHSDNTFKNYNLSREGKTYSFLRH